MDGLLDLLNAHLPLFKEEWDYVCKDHNDALPVKNRNVDRLKRNFASLHWNKMLTDDPLMLPGVQRAKRIRHLMTERAYMGDAEDTYAIASQAFAAKAHETHAAANVNIYVPHA